MTGLNKQTGELSEYMQEAMLVPGIVDKILKIAEYRKLDSIHGKTTLRDAAMELQKLYPELIYDLNTTPSEYNGYLDVVIEREGIK